VTRWFTWRVGFHPLRFEQALIIQPNEQGIECSRLQPGVLGKLIAIMPAARPLHQRGEQLSGFGRTVRSAGHRRISTYVEL